MKKNLIDSSIELERKLNQAKTIIVRIVWEFSERDNVGYYHGCIGCLEDAFDFMGWHGTVTIKQILKIMYPYWTDEELDEELKVFSDPLARL